MSERSNSKLKFYYLIKILMDYTDEEHKITIVDIIKYLGKYDIRAERKSIYNDILLLQNNNIIEVEVEKTNCNKYYVVNRDFELAELKLLVDSVQSSKFIATGKTKELIKKLEKLTSIHEGKSLDRQVALADRVKTTNKSIYYNIDRIHEAIKLEKQIKFKYFEYNIDKQLVARRGGSWYFASPYALSWAEENYYVITYYERYDTVSHFRVDRMKDINILDEDRLINNELKHLNLANYSKKSFGMFRGNTKKVKLECDNSLINVVIDKFGKDITILEKREDIFIIRVDVIATDTFYGWLFMFGGRVKILGPIEVVEGMKNLLNTVVGIYESY